MTLRNALKSMTWNSLLRRSRGRLRRKPRALAPICLSAEVLEQRQLLSAANVNLCALAGAITLSATDSGNHDVTVHRVDATNVEFDPGAGTQITYLGTAHTSAFDVAIPIVLGVTVNLGSGFDTYNVFGLSVLGNIAFNGNCAGGTGADLSVFATDSDMVIGGSVIFNLGTQTGTSQLSSQEVSTEGAGNLTICGSILATEAGPASNDNSVFSDGAGSVLVRGSILISQSGTGQKGNDLFADNSGNLTVGGFVSLADSGSGFHENDIFAEGSGSVRVGLWVSNCESGSGEQDFGLFSEGSGGLTVCGLVISNTSGTGSQQSEIFNDGSGNLSVAGIIFTSCGSTDESLQQIFNDGDGNISVGAAGVMLINSGPADHTNQMFDDGAGTLSVCGLVTVLDSGDGFHTDEIFTDSGHFSALGFVVVDSGAGEHHNEIFSDGGAIAIGLAGVAISDCGAGQHLSEIFTAQTGSIQINGSVTVIDTGTGFSELDIETFDPNSNPGGNITICGSVTYNNALNSTGHDHVSIMADTSDRSGVVTIGGALTLLLANDAASGNRVDLGGDFDESSTQLAIGGPVLIVSGAGADTFEIDGVAFKSAVTINTGTNPATEGQSDFIDIVASEFDGLVSITMLGANARLHVNAQSGFAPTVFNGPVSVFMTGPDAAIVLSNAVDSGTRVVFNSTVGNRSA